MSLSKRGQMRASLVAPGGPMHAFYRGITNEWRPDFTEGTSQLDISENDLMAQELSTAFKALHTTSKDDWLSPHGPITPCCSLKLLNSCSTVINNILYPHTHIQADHLISGSGCSLLLEAVARVVCDAKDVILTPGPIWPVFTTIFAKAEVELSVISSTVDERSVSTEDAMKEMESLLNWTEETQRMWELHLDHLVGDGKLPRAMLLSSPQNPLGRCYPRSFLIRALEFCEKHDLFLISDEVFALSEHKDTDHAKSVPRFQSVLSIDLSTEVRCNAARIIALWSVSKDFGASGARLAVAAIPANNALKSALLSLAPSFRVSSLADSFFAAFFVASNDAVSPDLSVTDPVGEEVPREILHTGSLLFWYMRENSRRLASAKQRLQEWCQQRDIPYLEADAGHFLMLYFGPWLDRRISAGHSRRELEQAFHVHLLSHDIALQPGLSARCPRAGWFRATFSREERYMDEALSRLDRALNRW